MSLFGNIRRFFSDPPPAYVFEISAAGIAAVRTDAPEHISFHELQPGVIELSPLVDNVKNSDAFGVAVASIFPDRATSHPRPSALILPDYSARLQVLDFDTFPSKFEEQQALVRFRMKKTVPFDVEAAAVSSAVQTTEGGKTEVIAALTALGILAPYEAAFRNAGYHPGLVTTSALASLCLIPPSGLTVTAKLSGATLTILVTDKQRLKMFRCLELEAGTTAEMLAAIQTTIAFVEDTFSARPAQVLLCGFGRAASEIAREWQIALGLPAEVLTTSRGTPGPHNSGILGYLESQTPTRKGMAAMPAA